MKSPYLGEEEDNFLQKKKNAGSFIVLHALYMYLTWNTKFKKKMFLENWKVIFMSLLTAVTIMRNDCLKVWQPKMAEHMKLWC